jgi:hypothetical protein
MADARRRGRHLYIHDWSFSLDLPASDAVEAVVSWCRETLAHCRRPFGIDYFDLVLAVCEPGDRQAEKLQLEKLRIVELYDESLPSRLAKVLSRRKESRETGSEVRVSAAIFSWGDAAHEALPATW